MNSHEAYTALAPYLSNEINYSDEEKIISTHNELALNIEKDFLDEFSFKIKVQSPYNYTWSFTISIEIDGKGLFDHRNDYAKHADGGSYLTTIFVSAKGPFCTFNCFKKVEQEDLNCSHSIKWDPIASNDLAEFVKPWIDWLCQRSSLTYISYELLQQQVAGRETELSCAPATLFTIMFSEI